MQKNMPKWGTVLLAAVIVAWVGGWVTPAFAKKAPVEQTGQTTSYAPEDDGNIQAGVPFPTQRFTDEGNGTVRDKLTQLIWLKNADCFGFGTWAQALTDANTLAHGACGLTDDSVEGDWRLPNVKELQSRIDFCHFNPALPSGHPFTGVPALSTTYWSSTTVETFPSVAFRVRLRDGHTIDAPKDINNRVWLVRGGIDPPTR